MKARRDPSGEKAASSASCRSSVEPLPSSRASTTRGPSSLSSLFVRATVDPSGENEEGSFDSPLRQGVRRRAPSPLRLVTQVVALA